jgi:NADPH:quinone reductase-like Zn-dependent oxidoreductase
MKAVRFREHGGCDVLRYEDVPDPTPRPTDVLLRVKAVALNHLDVWLRKGLPGMSIPLPKIGGCDIAGEVVAVGDLCSRIAVGQRILVSPGISCGQCAACLRGDDNLCRVFKIVGGYALTAAAPISSACPRPTASPDPTTSASRTLPPSR